MDNNSCYGREHNHASDAPTIPTLRRSLMGGGAQAGATSEEDADSISQRLFGQVIRIGTQVCQGPCVGNDKIAFAFAGNNG
jgi:hypothetical protein